MQARCDRLISFLLQTFLFKFKVGIKRQVNKQKYDCLFLSWVRLIFFFFDSIAYLQLLLIYKYSPTISPTPIFRESESIWISVKADSHCDLDAHLQLVLACLVLIIHLMNMHWDWLHIWCSIRHWGYKDIVIFTKGLKKHTVHAWG